MLLLKGESFSNHILAETISITEHWIFTQDTFRHTTWLITPKKAEKVVARVFPVKTMRQYLVLLRGGSTRVDPRLSTDHPPHPNLPDSISSCFSVNNTMWVGVFLLMITFQEHFLCWKCSECLSDASTTRIFEDKTNWSFEAEVKIEFWNTHAFDSL